MNAKFAVMGTLVVVMFVGALTLMGATTETLQCVTEREDVTCVLDSYTPSETRIFFEPEQNITSLPKGDPEPGTVMDPQPSCSSKGDLIVCKNLKEGESAVFETQQGTIPVEITAK